MKIVIDIKNVHIWYRESTKEWVISVQASTNSCLLSLNYSAKTLNKAKKQMCKCLSQELLAEEISHNLDTILSNSESEGEDGSNEIHN